MSYDPAITKMLANYKDNISQIDKMREILQQTALLGLARHQFFEHALFYGGTALRILYGLDRYSEDLDFSLMKKDPHFDFAPYIEGMHKEARAMGFDLDVSLRKKNPESGIWSAFLKANTFTLLLSFKEVAKGINPDQKIQVKLEIDTDPPPSHLPFESKLVMQPVPFYINTFAIVDLCAGKVHAALCRNWKNRVKGRDWYDLIWYIQSGVPVNIAYLRARMVQAKNLGPTDPLDIQELLRRLHAKIDEIDWQLAKEDISSFIPDKSKITLWSPQFFHDAIAHLRWVDDPVTIPMPK